MRLYYLPTMNSRKVCAVAKHLDIAIDYVLVAPGPDGLGSAAYRALNPNARAPTLVDGDHVLWESAAIAVHLAARTGSDLWPRDGIAQADVLRWISWDAWHWGPAVGVAYFEHAIKPMIGAGPPDMDAVAAAAPAVRRHAAVLEQTLAVRDFLCGGDTPTIADFCVGAMLPDWADHGLALAEFPKLRAWNDRLLALPAWADPWPAGSSGGTKVPKTSGRA